MALNTYDELVKEIVSWTHRGDLGVKIPDFIRLAENAMYSNDTEVLKTRSMEVVSTATTSGQYLALPDNYESSRSARIVLNDGGELKYQAPQQMVKKPSVGRPNFFTVIGDEIQFDITPDDDYEIELQYYRKATPLSESNQTNEILLNHPSIYLYGALSFAFRFAQDNEQATVFRASFIDAIRGANKGDKKGRYGSAPYVTVDTRNIV